MNRPKTNLLAKNPRMAVPKIVETNTTPGNLIATDGRRLSTEEKTYQITKNVSPKGPIITKPCKKYFKN